MTGLTNGLVGLVLVGGFLSSPVMAEAGRFTDKIDTRQKVDLEKLNEGQRKEFDEFAGMIEGVTEPVKFEDVNIVYVKPEIFDEYKEKGVSEEELGRFEGIYRIIWEHEKRMTYDMLEQIKQGSSAAQDRIAEQSYDGVLDRNLDRKEWCMDYALKFLLEKREKNDDKEVRAIAVRVQEDQKDFLRRKSYVIFNDNPVDLVSEKMIEARMPWVKGKVEFYRKLFEAGRDEDIGNFEELVRTAYSKEDYGAYVASVKKDNIGLFDAMKGSLRISWFLFWTRGFVKDYIDNQAEQNLKRIFERYDKSVGEIYGKRVEGVE